MQSIQLTNDIWKAEISTAPKGRVVRLVDRASGRVCVLAPAAADPAGGRVAGLEPWVKYGNLPDHNTGVLSAFAPIHGQPLTVRATDGAVRLESREAGLALALEWRLPPGDAPLTCRLTLTNESAPVDDFQFECFFIWHVPEPDRTRIAASLPGHAPFAVQPYGEIYYGAGESAAGCAAWWLRGTREGVAMRAVEQIVHFFVGIQGDRFVLGPHSLARRLAPGETLTAAFEIAPLAKAQSWGWPCDVSAADTALAAEQRRAGQIAVRVGGLAEWVKPAGPAPLARRALHITLQYGPSDLHGTIAHLEKVAAPAGYNQLMVEVDRAFPYRSHPQVTVPWAWSRAQWAEFIGAARSLGFEVIPQYNALGHQEESALATAYPELREDGRGWGLCPRHPKTQPYLHDLLAELIDAFAPKIFHVGLDEVDVPSHPQSFCICPRCRGADGGTLFAEHVLGLHQWLAARGLETMMWADMLLHRPEHNSVNGKRTGTWKAIDRLPRDIIMIDWVYSPVKTYAGSDYLLEAGFRVMGATWYDPRAVAEFARFAARRDLYGMCETTWSEPTIRGWPLVCVLLGGKYFQSPSITDDAPVLAEARALASKLAEGSLLAEK